MAKNIKPGDDLFTFAEKFTITTRAGLEISQHCPREYGLIISECINNGWLKPVAYVSDEEYMMLKLAS